MLETQPLCTGAKPNLRGRTWGEIEKNSFIALPGEEKNAAGGDPEKLCPTPGGFGEGFIAWFKDGVADKDRGVCRACVHVLC